MIRRAATWAALFALAAQAPALAAYSPGYWYQGDKLVLSIWSSAPEEIEIRVQPVGEDGRPQGAPAKQPAALLKGQSNVEIAAGTAPGHRLRFTRGGRAFEVWANRGSWAAGPEGLEITRRPRGARAPEQLVAIDDVELALGYSASVEQPAQDRPLILERSFGKPAGQGIRPEDKSALILVARGTVGPVKLTVASRHGKALEYFDEALVLEEGWRRYVLPLAAFRSRVARTKIESIHTVAIESALPATRGSTIAIGYVGLGARGPRIERLERSGDRVKLSIQGGRADLRLAYTRSGTASSEPARQQKAPFELTDPLAQKAWICWGPVDAAACDPPDAPRTYRLIPPAPRQPFLIDDFDTEADVNAHRELVVAFASSATLSARPLRRAPGSARLSFEPRHAGDYVGISEYWPGDAPPTMRTLAIRLQPEAAPTSVEIGLEDQARKTARLELSSYQRGAAGAPETIQIPLEAFEAAYSGYVGKGKLGSLRRLIITIFGRENVGKTAALTLDQIELRPELAPLVIASFERSRPELSDVSGLMRTEATGGALDLDLNAPGHYGRAAALTVRGLTKEGYALFSIGLNGLDLSRRERLVLWARGASKPALVLVSGKKRASLPLEVNGASWAKIEVPLGSFGQKELLKRADQLLLVWEGRAIEREALVIDELRIE